MSEERDGLEPDDIDLELGDEEVDEVEPDEVVDDVEPDEPLPDPREQRRQAEQLRQQQRQNAEFLIAQGAQANIPRVRQSLERLRYASDEDFEAAVNQLVHQNAAQQIAALRDRDDAETFRKKAKREGMSAADIREVEKNLQIARNSGLNLTRDAVASYLAGERARGRSTGGGSSGAPAAPRGPSGRARRSAQDIADEKLLKSVTWGRINRGY